MTLCIVLRLIGTLFYPGFGLSACMMIGILLMLLALVALVAMSLLEATRRRNRDDD